MNLINKLTSFKYFFRSLHPNGVGSDNIFRRRQGSLPGRQDHRGGQLLAPGQLVGAIRGQCAAAAARELPGHTHASTTLTTALHTWQEAED